MSDPDMGAYLSKTAKNNSAFFKDVFDTMIQKTRVWLNDLMSEMEWEGELHRAYFGLRAVLHALRDRLTVEEAVHLGAQLPMLVRGFYYEGWKLAGKPVKGRHKEEFLDHIKAAFRDDATVDPERVVRAVFNVLAKRTSKGEIEDVKHLLPRGLQDLWPK